MTIIQHPSACAGFLRGTVRRSLAHKSTAVQDAAADIAVDLFGDGHSGHRALTQALDWADRCYRVTGDDGPSAA